MDLYVIAGHGAGDPGACANGAQEAERVRALAHRIKELGGDRVTLHDMQDNAYASGALNRLNIGKDTGVIELHMDSAGAGARGAHVVIKQGFKPDAVDNALADKLCAILPGRSQKIVGRSDLANPNRAAKRGINYRLLECGFITSPEDLGIFNSKMDEIARAILDAFGVQAGPAPAPAPAPQPAPAPAPSPQQDASEHGGTGFGGTYRCNVPALNVRTAPTVNSGTVATYKQGMTVALDDWYKSADGYIWGRYTGGSGAKRYVAVGKATGKPEPGDFLVKVGGAAPATAPSVDIDQMARDVIAGKYGSGDARKRALGDNYDTVQKRVNEILGGGGSGNKSIDAIAREVIAGKWGNDPQRSQKLRSAGYDPAAVQRRVNQLL